MAKGLTYFISNNETRKHQTMRGDVTINVWVILKQANIEKKKNDGALFFTE